MSGWIELEIGTKNETRSFRREEIATFGPSQGGVMGSVCSITLASGSTYYTCLSYQELKAAIIGEHA